MKPATVNESPAQRLAAELAEGVAPAQVLNTLRQALVADQVARDGSRQPDHRARLDAAKLWLAYAVGLPVQRSESVSVNLDADSAVGIEERLRHSPALRRMLREMLERAEGALDV